MPQSSPLKIAFIREQYRPDGGAERILARIMDSLRAEKSIEIHLICKTWAGNIPADIQLHRIEKKGLTRTGRHKHFVKSVQKILQEQEFDLVQSHERVPGCSIYRAGDGIHAEWVSTRMRYSNPFKAFLLKISPFHRYMQTTEQQLFQDPALKKIIFNSEMVKQDLLRYYPETPRDKLTIIHNGIDLQQFTPAINPENMSRLRTSLKLKPETRILLYVGSGFERKGLTEILHALPHVSPDWHLIVIGKDKKQQTYEQLSKHLAINTRVIFANMQTDMPAWYQLADLLVHPARYEPFPNVILEAMASATAVITSERCGAVEIIEHGHNGYLCTAGDAESLAMAIRQAENDDLARIGQQARLTAKNFSLEKMKHRMLTLYQDLIDD